MSEEYDAYARKKIGEGIQICMKDRKMSINRLEKESKVSKTIIYKILRGQEYQITSLIRVMRHLQVHLEMSLMSEDNNIHTMTGHKPSQN